MYIYIILNIYIYICVRITFGSIHKILMDIGQNQITGTKHPSNASPLKVPNVSRRWLPQLAPGCGIYTHCTVGVSFWGVTTGVGCYVN